jgi:hypothetical protein
MTRFTKFAAALAVAVSLFGCGAGKPAGQGQGVYLLLDTSGTYTQELVKAKQVISAILAKLNPGDSFAVARIDSGSFSEKDIVAKVTFDDRPSVANQQKRQFQAAIDKFIKTVKPAGFSDVTGGLLQAVEYLNEKNNKAKTIIVFSDLEEELAKGFVRNIDIQFDGFDVVALNVTKLGKDNVDPRKYMGRVDHWQRRVEKGGGQWRVLNDLDQLDKLVRG